MSGFRKVDGAEACAARISARFVTDLDPGIATVAETADAPRYGAGHSSCSVMC